MKGHIEEMCLNNLVKTSAYPLLSEKMHHRQKMVLVSSSWLSDCRLKRKISFYSIAGAKGAAIHITLNMFDSDCKEKLNPKKNI